MGNCGMSFCAPLSPNTKPQLQDRMDRQGIDIDIKWNLYDVYKDGMKIHQSDKYFDVLGFSYLSFS